MGRKKKLNLIAYACELRGADRKLLRIRIFESLKEANELFVKVMNSARVPATTYVDELGFMSSSIVDVEQYTLKTVAYPDFMDRVQLTGEILTCWNNFGGAPWTANSDIFSW